MTEVEQFAAERAAGIARLRDSADMRALGVQFVRETASHKYSYNFTWMGRPLIQFPQDMVALQEIVWRIRPDVIVETGVAHGGSLIYSASLLELIGGDGRVVGVDIDIRAHNRVEIEQHPLARRIDLVQGSSVAPETVAEVRRLTAGRNRVMVVLDSNHTHAHVAEELRSYSPLVRKGSYLIVYDTIIEDFPAGSFPDRPWDKGNNPKTAVREFIKTNPRFRVDQDIDAKLLITAAPEGYLECVED
jgi:cephalosporin hydroxylase